MMVAVRVLLGNGTLWGHPLSRKLLHLDLAIWSRLQILESEMKEKYIPTGHENVNKIYALAIFVARKEKSRKNQERLGTFH